MKIPSWRSLAAGGSTKLATHASGGGMRSREQDIAACEPRPSARNATSRERGESGRLAFLALAALAACYLLLLVSRPLVAPDEFRYGEIAREMLTSGDWIVPRLNGLVYFEKPVLGYWITAASLAVFGHGAFAVRLPFALSTLATAALVFGLLRRWGPGSRWAAAGAAAFLSSAGVLAIGTSAVLDALFALCVSASLAALFAASERAPGAARQAWLAASGAACGLAFLTKGFLAFAIPVCVAVPYLLWSRRPRDLLRLAATPLAVALLVAAPWSLAIGLREGDFWRYFVLDEHWRRFAGGASAQHAEPLWFFLPVVLVGALPWTPLAPSLCRLRAPTPLVRFAICWFAAPLLLLSASSGKLATYALPCAAPLCVWMTCGAAGLAPDRLARRLRWTAVAVAACAALVALALLTPWAATLDPQGAGAAPRLAAAGVTALAAGLAAIASRRARPGAGALGIGAALPLLFSIAGIWLPVPAAKAPERFLSERVGAIPDDATVVADRSFVHPVCWWLRRADVHVLGAPGELVYGLQRPGQAHRLLPDPALDALVRDAQRTRPVVVIARRDHFDPIPDPTLLRSEEQAGAVFALYGVPSADPAREL